MRDCKLNDIEFGSVFEVLPGGEIREGVKGVWAPELYEDGSELYGLEGWDTVTDGYSGQYLYNGPVMHPSEGIGGQLAKDILRLPGIYALCVVDVLPDSENDEPEPSGWCVVMKEEE